MKEVAGCMQRDGGEKGGIEKALGNESEWVERTKGAPERRCIVCAAYFTLLWPLLLKGNTQKKGKKKCAMPSNSL